MTLSVYILFNAWLVHFYFNKHKLTRTINSLNLIMHTVPYTFYGIMNSKRQWENHTQKVKL